MTQATVQSAPPRIATRGTAPGTRGADVLRRRVVATVVGGAALGLLSLAAWMEPSAAGHGTHQQLGLPKCDWIARFDLPCPTCGMTTAFAHATEGNFVASFLSQPLGFLLALATAASLLVSVYVVWTGSPVARIFARWWTNRMIFVLVAAILLSWGFKILQVKGML